MRAKVGIRGGARARSRRLWGNGRRGASAAHRQQAPCPKGSVAAKIAGKGLPEERAEVQARVTGNTTATVTLPHRPASCGRPSRPSDAVSRKIDVGLLPRHHLPWQGQPDGHSRKRWWCIGRSVVPVGAHSRQDDPCLPYDRAGLGVSEPRRPPGPVPAARVVEELHTLLAGAAFRRRTSSEAGPRWLLQSAVHEALPWRSGGPRQRGRNADRPPGEPSWMKPPGQPPIDLIGVLASQTRTLRGGRRGARGRAGSGIAAIRRADARTIRRNSRRLRGAVEDLAETRCPAVDVVDPRPRRLRRARHPARSPDLTAEAFRQVIQAVRAGAPLLACAATPLPLLLGTCLDPSSP